MRRTDRRFPHILPRILFIPVLDLLARLMARLRKAGR